MQRSETEIRDWCANYLATALDIAVSRIDPDAKLARLGMDSARTVSFMLALEDWFGMELDPEIAFEYPTISQLAQHLSTRVADQKP